MLSRFLTALLVLLLGASTVAWIVALMRERGIRPLKSLWKHVRKMSFIGLSALALWVVPLIQYGSTKNGSTNNVQMVIGHVVPVCGNPLPITSANTTRTLTAEDFERGFVMSRVGTGETYGFSAPSNAVVCADWRAFGAATDWIYVALTNWAFQVGTNAVGRFRIHSDGWVEAGTTGILPIAKVATFWPFHAALGVVPETNWHLLPADATGGTPVVPVNGQDARSPSMFWHYVTPSNTLQLTWQNALLDRDTDTPLSFQIEFRTDGQFTYRYDLSRCGVRGAPALPGDGGTGTTGILPVEGITIGASFAGNEWTTNALPTNVTSMAFYPLSAEDAVNHDPDNDGLATIDELFVCHTDPRHHDSDYDGLTDYEELFVYHTDPLDPYSAGGPYCDGVTVRLGGLEPFAYPEGSTNTVLEHVFYSGTTNGAFAYPQSSDDTAILKVMVSGTGTGRLVVGDSVVPLIAPPQMRSGLPGNAFTLLLPVVKGETYPAYVRGDGSLDVSLDSDDFAFGALPTFNSFGHFNFPNTEATPACIHDFNLRSRSVSLPTREDAELLTATWTGGAGVSVSNAPPRSAVINGNFYAGSIKNVSYALSHPHYLFGQTQYSQPVRFCPCPHNTNPTSPDPDDPPWFSSGEGVSSTGNDGQDGHWCCYWGTCGSYCECGCDCANNPGGQGGDNTVGDNEDFDDYCPDHYMPYEDCDETHENEYSNTVQSVTHLAGVLYIREPPLYEPIYLDVPTEHVHCCPCPEHWTNYVGVAYKSYRLRLVDSNGLPFDRTETSCYVNLAGVYPSSAVGDAEIAFSRNGDIYQHHHKTVLGVAIKGHETDLAAYNALNSNFGYPMTVCTNLWYAPQMRLVTNVKLPGGHVRLELADVSGQFTVWYPDYYGGTYRKLLDTSSIRVKNLTMAYWKALMRRATDGNTSELPIYITSSTPGHVTLKFRYWNVVNDKFVEDEAVQCITSVRPPLRLDITRDGSIDDGDVVANLARKSFNFWTNEDFWKNDDAFDGEDPSSLNVSAMLVNGRNDLINLLPVAVDISPFIEAWGNAATFRIRGNSFVRYATADVDWEYVDQPHIDDCFTTAGGLIRSAQLTVLSAEGMTLGTNEMSLSASLTLLLEAVQPCFDPVEIIVEVSGKTVFSYRAPLNFSRVRDMYRWFNRRYVAEWEARAWADGVFKRLWWSGLNTKFTAVAWRGNEGQVYFPSQGLVTPDYQVNVEHAFATAPSLATLLNGLPGDKYILAHSLGNMEVSSAIHDHGLQYAKYFMLNAAVPVEAYDAMNGVTAESKAGMTHPEWVNYPDRVRASHWRELFPEGDGRRTLTWKGRFANVTNTVNYYSSEEEVLANGNGSLPNLPRRDHAWSDQELWKGNKPFTDLIFFSMGRNEGGWSFNSDHDVYDQPLGNLPPVLRRRTPDETTNLTDAVLRESPFFGHFGNRNIYTSTNGIIVSENAAYRAQLLADAIPAESFAVGANPIPTCNTNGFVNVNMAAEFKDDEQFYKSPSQDWIHSFFLKVPYMCIHAFYEDVVSRIPKENANE